MGPKWPIHPNLGKPRVFLGQRVASVFSVYRIHTSYKKSEKSNELILRKRHGRIWIDRGMGEHTKVNSQESKNPKAGIRTK